MKIAETQSKLVPCNLKPSVWHGPDEAWASARPLLYGELALATDTPLSTIVGASIAVCLVNSIQQRIGLRQIMLPSLARGHRHDAMLAADALLEELFNQVNAPVSHSDHGETDGVSNEIRAKLFGGADLGANELCFSDGAQSLTFVRTWLNARHIPVVAESVGGPYRREIVAIPPSGAVYCRQLPVDEEFLNEERSKMVGSRGVTHKAELF